MTDLSDEINAIKGAADILWRMSGFSYKEEKNEPLSCSLYLLSSKLSDISDSLEKKNTPLTEEAAGI